MRYEIKGETLPVVICHLEDGEQMVTEKGAMSWMSPNMKMESGARARAAAREASREAQAIKSTSVRVTSLFRFKSFCSILFCMAGFLFRYFFKGPDRFDMVEKKSCGCQQDS